MNRRSATRFFANCVCYLVIWYPASADEITIKGVIVDPTSGQAIEGVAIHLHEVDHSGKIGAHINSVNTDSIGEYRFEFPDPKSRLQLSCRKGSTNSQNLYGPAFIAPLAGKSDLVVDIAIDPSSADTSTSSRKRMSALGRMLQIESGIASVKDRNWPIEYVFAEISGKRGNADFRYGEELDAVVKALRPSGEQIAVTDRAVLVADKGVFATCGIPRRTLDPKQLELHSTKLPPDTDLVGLYARNFFVLHNEGLGERLGADLSWTSSDNITHGVFASASDLTTASGALANPIIVAGTSNGTIVLTKPGKDQPVAVFDVGVTPVATTAVSKDGLQWAAATTDGSYRIWSIQDEQLPGDARLIREGQLEFPFPSKMAFSPDDTAVIVATGLGSHGNSLIVLESKPDSTRKTMTATSSTIVQIKFTHSPNLFLAGSRDGSTTVYRISDVDQDMRVSKQFDLQGISAFGVSPDGESTVLKVFGQDLPLIFPTSKLLDRSFDKTEYGIQSEQ